MANNNFIIELLDGTKLSIAPNVIPSYPTIQDQAADLAEGAEIVLNYQDPTSLSTVMTTDYLHIPDSLDTYVKWVSAVDYLGNVDQLFKILNNMLIMFNDPTTIATFKQNKKEIIKLMYKLPPTVETRFLTPQFILEYDADLADVSITYKIIISDNLNIIATTRVFKIKSVEHAKRIVMDKGHVIEEYDPSVTRISSNWIDIIDDNSDKYFIKNVGRRQDEIWKGCKYTVDCPSQLYFKTSDENKIVISGDGQIFLIYNFHNNNILSYSIRSMKNPGTILIQKIFTQHELRSPYRLTRYRIPRVINYSPRLRVIILQSIDDITMDRYRLVNMAGQVTTIGIPHLIPQRIMVRIINMKKQGADETAFHTGDVANIIFSHDETSFMEIMIKNKKFEIRAIGIDGQIIHDTFSIKERPIGLTNKVLITMYLTKEPFYYEGKLQEKFYINDLLNKRFRKRDKKIVVNIQLRLWTDPHKIIKVIKSPLPKTRMEPGGLFIGPVSLRSAIPGPLNTFMFTYQYDEPFIILPDQTAKRGKYGVYIAKYMVMPYVNMADFLMDKLEYQDEQAFLDDLNSS